MQLGVALVSPSSYRRVQRGGGADIRDDLSVLHAAENCSEICYYGMMFGGLGGTWWYDLPNYNGYQNPHYLKCTEASAAAPLNGLRLQHASQFNTISLDPTVPKMNVTDWKACLRMKFNFCLAIEINMRIIHTNFFNLFKDQS